jgi:DNA ligase (NAD+)
MARNHKYKEMSVDELEKLVRYHNNLYFVKNDSEITDYQFDKLVEELKKRKPDSKVLEEIGSDLTPGLAKAKHDFPMLSLDKAYAEKAMLNWASKFEGDIVASPKLDGCAISIKYDDKGELLQALTRGKGQEGVLITENVKGIEAIPTKIDLKGVEIRGEVYMEINVFYDNYKDKFANPRNLAAGAVKQKDPRNTAKYNLSFKSYDLRGIEVEDEMDKRKVLKKNHLEPVESELIKREDIQDTFEKYLKERSEGRFDYETDGVVYKVNNLKEQDRLGETAHHPRYAIAYKFKGDSGETTLSDVVWSVARTGVITPVAVVEPVKLSGATIVHASLHNYSIFKKLELTKNARVLMMRRGGVIPNLEKVIEHRKVKFEAPLKCPSCKAKTKVKGEFLYCTNPKGCTETVMAELEHFVKTIECDGYGSKLIQQLYDKGFVKDSADFYTLTKEKLVHLKRMGGTLAEKLIRNINNKKELTLEVFLRSLGIKELGRHVAGILANNYRTWNKVKSLKRLELAAIHTIGDVIADYVVEGLKEKKPLINKLLTKVTIKKVSDVSEGPLAGKKFLFTGSMVTMDRKEGQHIVEEGGGVIASSVSKDLDYLVVGDGGGAGSKLAKAKKLIEKGEQVKIISEKEFLKIVK